MVQPRSADSFRAHTELGTVELLSGCHGQPNNTDVVVGVVVLSHVGDLMGLHQLRIVHNDDVLGVGHILWRDCGVCVALAKRRDCGAGEKERKVGTTVNMRKLAKEFIHIA